MDKSSDNLEIEHFNPDHFIKNKDSQLIKEYSELMRQEGLRLDPRIAEVIKIGINSVDDVKKGNWFKHSNGLLMARNPGGPFIAHYHIPESFWNELLPESERQQNYLLLLQGKFEFHYHDHSYQRRQELTRKIEQAGDITLENLAGITLMDTNH